MRVARRSDLSVVVRIIVIAGAPFLRVAPRARPACLVLRPSTRTPARHKALLLLRCCWWWLGVLAVQYVLGHDHAPTVFVL